MKRLLTITAIIIALATAGTALAGGDKKAGYNKKADYAKKAEYTKKAGHDCDASVGDCLTAKVAEYKQRGWFGVSMEATKAGHFAITEVIADSPAEAAGFLVGDVLLTLNGVEFTKANKQALKAAQKALTAGSKVAYVVSRAGEKQKLAVTLGEIPTEVLASWIGYHMLTSHATVQVASN